MFFDVYKQLCTENGKTPNGVAKELGFASPSVTQWKHGSTPRPAGLKRIADYFGVPVEYFLSEKQKEKPTPVFEGEPLSPPGYGSLNPASKAIVDQLVDGLLKIQPPTTKIKLYIAAEDGSRIETEMDMPPGFKLPDSVQVLPDEYKGKTGGKPSAPEET